MHPMTDQCSIASRVLPPGVSLGTGLLVATWLLTTDHRSGWSVPWPLCRLICRWSLGYWPPITVLGDLSPNLSAAWSVGGHLVTDHRSPFWVICPLTSLPPDLSVVTWLLTPRSSLLAIASLISLSPGPRVTLRVVHVVLCCWRHWLPMTDRINYKHNIL